METDGIVTNTVQATVLQTTLDEISTHRGRGNAASDERCCVICLDAVSEDCVAQPCAHRNFDFVCLANWLEQKPNCPLCNAGIKEVQYGFSNDGKAWKTYTTSGPSTTEQSEAASRYSAPQPPRPRRRREYRPAREFSADEALSRRRHVYRHQLYSLHVGSNRHSSYQDLSPRLFEQRPDLVSRARAWIRRELRVFEFLSPREDSDDSTVRRRANNSEFLLEYIIAILKTGTQLRKIFLPL